MYPEYNTSSVLQSLVGNAITELSKSTLKVEEIIKLRKEATVNCENFTIYPKCLNRCLFDVFSDPCETTDLSSTYPKVCT